MKFRYYITSIHGIIVGTDDTQTALYYAASEDNFVVDTQNGEWLQAGGISAPIQDIED